MVKETLESLSDEVKARFEVVDEEYTVEEIVKIAKHIMNNLDAPDIVGKVVEYLIEKGVKNLREVNEIITHFYHLDMPVVEIIALRNILKILANEDTLVLAPSFTPDRNYMDFVRKMNSLLNLKTLLADTDNLIRVVTLTEYTEKVSQILNLEENYTQYISIEAGTPDKLVGGYNPDATIPDNSDPKYTTYIRNSYVNVYLELKRKEKMIQEFMLEQK